MHRLQLKIYLIVCALLALTLCASAVPAMETAASQAGPDSLRSYPKKMSSRDNWEYAVNAPLKLAYLPVKIVFTGCKNSIAWVTDNRIPQRVRALLISDDGRTGLIPTAAPRKGVGATFFHKGWVSPDSKFKIKARAGLNNRQDYEIELKRVLLFDDRLSWGFSAEYEFASDEKFFGSGMDNDPDRDKTNYAHERAQGEIRLGLPLGSYFHLGGEFGIEHNNILAGRSNKSLSTTDEYPVLTGIDDREVRFSRIRLAVEFDNRDTAGATTAGWLASVRGGYFKQLEESDYEFYKLNADVRTYLNLFYRRVLMLRVATEVTSEVSGSLVPFYYLSELGSYETIRGFSQGRFRGSDALLASAEYSWPVSRFGDFLLFVDAGEVLGDLNDFEAADLEVGWGGGFRMCSRESVILKLLFGKSKDEWRFYFALN